MKNLRQLFLLLTLAYVVWAGLFIHNTSFVIDGVRYYCLFDDAMISMRYAENWVNGKGIVWNEGEFVEGYTNPLQVVFMAGCLLIAPKIQAVLFVQLLGIGMVIACSWFAGKIFENIQGASEGIWIVWLGVYLLYPLSYWSLMGMETGLVSALLLTGVYLATSPSKTANGWLLGAVLALLYLARPDASLYGFLIIGYLGYQDISLRKFPSEAVKALLALVGTIAGHIAWRLHYYGELKPNTAILKLGGWDTSDRISNGIAYMQPFVAEVSLLGLLALLAILLKPSLKVLLLAVIIGTGWLYQAFVGGDAWGYWRLLTPSVVVITILATVGITELLKSSRLHFQVPNVVVSLVTILIATYWFNAPYIREQLLVKEALHIGDHKTWVQRGLLLKALTTESAKIGVICAGATPFFSERYAIDFLGKSDPRIAKGERKNWGNPWWNQIDGRRRAYQMDSYPGHDKYDLAYSIGQLMPDYVDGLAWGRESVPESISSLYQTYLINDQRLILLKNSPEVRWQ